MKSLFLFFLMCCNLLIFGQDSNRMSITDLSSLETSTTGPFLDLPLHADAGESPFVTLAIKTQKNSIHKIQYRYLTENTWSAWTYLRNDLHNTDLNQDISSLLFLPNSTQKIQLKLNNFIADSDDEIHLFYPKRSMSGQLTVRHAKTSGDCPCPQPSFKGRDQWCQNGNCPVDITPVITEVSHLIVHHTAGSNTSSDWSAVVYSIWNYHVNTNGWDDIGYNWLIDPNGVIYEGRADNIQGAHFCGKNGNTMGICILGTYTDVDPKPQSMETLKRLFAWKSCQDNLDPTGISYHPPSDEELFVVSGHQDGCATACPGDMLYALLPNLRDSISYEIENSCGNILPPVQLYAALTNSNTVTLNWTDQSDNETTFVIERREENSAYFYPIATNGTDNTSFEDAIPVNSDILEYRVLAANQQDTSIYSNIAQVDVTTSTSNNEELEGIKVYPSLFNDYINITNYEEVSANILILDTQGKILYNAVNELNKDLLIETQNWKSGVYFIHIRTANKETSIKIIKTNE